MIPRLYENATDALSGNMGIGSLAESTNSQVVRDANQIPVLTINYPMNGKFANSISHDMVIVVDEGLNSDEKNQAFRITNITKTQDGLTITAPAIAGDLSHIKLTQQVTNANATPNEAWQAITSAFVYPTPMVSFYSDVFKVANINWELSDDPVTAILMGDDQAGDKPTNTFQTLYGVDFYFDNYNIKALNNRAHDSGHIIKWRQNMSSISLDESLDDYYDGIMPYAKFTPNEIPDDYAGEGDPFDGQGDVQYVGTGQAPIYDSPFKGHTVVGHLANGTYYHVKATQSNNTANDDTWYQLDDGNWIDEHYFTFDKSGAYVVNKVKAQGHIVIPDDDDSSEGMYSAYRGIGTIVYAGRGKVAVWNSPFSGHSLTGQYIANGSRWKISYKATTEDGKTWYCVGTNQWVDGQYLSIQKTTDYVTTPTHGILKIKKKPVSYYSPTMQKQVNWNPKAGSRWKITNTATGADGSTLYQVNTHIWVKSDDDTIDFTNSGTVQPNDDNDRKAVVKATGRIPIYSGPNGKQVTEHWVKVGEQHQIFAQADNNGKTWYEIGEGQWVDASYFNFEADDDVAPGDDDSDSDDQGVEVEEQTVMLPEKFILANTAIHTEHPKIKVVDLSEYNVRDEEKLREVAEAYMREYRIGQIPLTMTVSYQQMNDDYKFLTAVDLYNMVGVQVDELGIAQKARVTSVTWDVLAERYTTITIGQMPIDYDHALGQYIEDKNTKTKEYANKRATHLFGQMHQLMKLKDDDRKAGLLKLAKQLGIYIDPRNADSDINILGGIVSDINSEVDASQSLIESMGGVIHAYPSWQDPQEFTATTSDGGKMTLTSNGLEFLGKDGIQRAAIDSYGRVNAENINAGTIKSLTAESATIKGDLYMSSANNGNYSVVSYSNGFSYTGNGSDIHLGPVSGTSGALKMGNDKWESGRGIYTNGYIITGNFIRCEGQTLTGADIQKLHRLKG